MFYNCFYLTVFCSLETFLSIHLISYPSVCCFASTIFCFYNVLFQRQDSGLTVLSFHNRIRNQLHSALQLVQQWKKPSFSVTPCSHISTHSSITHTSVDTRSPHHCSFSKINTCDFKPWLYVHWILKGIVYSKPWSYLAASDDRIITFSEVSRNGSRHIIFIISLWLLCI